MINKIRCWWFGCTPDIGNEQYYYDGERSNYHIPCKYCDTTDVSYSDLVGQTRHNLFKQWCNYWLFRKWIPEKCPDCGHRYKHDESVDHIPF